MFISKSRVFPILSTIVAGFSAFAWSAGFVTAPCQGQPAAVPNKSAELYQGEYKEKLEEWLDTSRSRAIPVKIYLPLNRSGLMPVVIFSHGLGGNREAAAYLCQALAQNGYLAVALQHPGSDESVWKNPIRNGQISLKDGREGGRRKLMSAMQDAASGENLKARVADVKFVISQIERLNVIDGPYKGKLDLAHIGMSGHSFGAGTTMALAGQLYGVGNKISVKEPRVKAALYLSPPVDLKGRDAKPIYAEIKVPGMLMTGTLDSSPIGNTPAAARVIPYKNISAPDQYLIVFDGGDHMIFGGNNGRRAMQRDQAKDAHFHEMINKLSLAFFDAYLKGDAKQKQWLQQNTGAQAYLGKQAVYEHK